MNRKRRKRTVLLAWIMAAACLLIPNGQADKYITLTFTGDCTIGSEEQIREAPDSFDSVAEQEGFSWFFANFREMFSEDDCTVINLEGVLSDSGSGEKTKKTYRFRGRTGFAEILTDASVELAGLANNHIADYGAQGMKNTISTLEKAGIGWAHSKDTYTLEKDGIRICFFAVDNGLHNTYKEVLRKKIAGIKAGGEANAVVVLYHNGNEYDARHSVRQSQAADFYIDAGADLVVMHHPHVVQGIGIRNNRTILYSLGNFVFGGNREIRTVNYRGIREVSSLYGLVAQVKLHFGNSGKYLGQQTVLYPVYTSSAAPRNNFQPFRLNAEQAEPVIDAIRYDTPEDVEIPDAETDEDGYVRIEMPYLTGGVETEAERERSVGGVPEEPPARPERSFR